jgi:hypothetical protein
MDDQAELLGADHPDTLRTRRNRALAMRDQGNVAEAIPELRAVIDLQERTLGPGHDETAQTRRNLAELMGGISADGLARPRSEPLSRTAV